MDTFATRARETSRLDAWIPLLITAGVKESSREILPTTAVDGSFKIGERSFPAQRVRTGVRLVFPVGGGREIPGPHLDRRGHVAPRPVARIVGADFKLEIADGDEMRVVDGRLDLIAFSAAPSQG